jgi:hypothetical protein
MGARTYKGPQNQRRVDGSEVFDNLTPGTIAMEQTYPGIAERNKRALTGEWLDVFLYQQIRSGRRCSCWGSNQNPSKVCEVCYGTGLVGGFQKYGTAAWLLDATTPNLALNNIVLYSSREGPEVFGLAENAVSGEIYVPGDLQGNWGPLDTLITTAWPGEDGEIGFFVRTPAKPDWQPLRDSLIGKTVSHVCGVTSATTLFNTPQRFDIKVTMQRSSIQAETPLLEKLFLRIYRTSKEAAILRANRPRSTHANSLSELGILDEWTSERWWFNQLVPRSVSDLDWFCEIVRDIRWKALDTDFFAPQNFALSWDIAVRKIQNFERGMMRFPL